MATRIAGTVGTSRDNNLRNFARLAERDPEYTFGLELTGGWSAAEVHALMAERVGVHPDPAYTSGVDTIDPERTLDRLDAVRGRLAAAVRRRERVLVATGHPAGVLAIHVEVAAALRDRGCDVLTAAAGCSLRTERGERREIRHVAGVAMISDGGELRHTHSPAPMVVLLGELTAIGVAPDLVVADHGWAGAAGQAGIDTVGYADSNDPALFVGEAEGRILASVPLDDNVLPHLYAPLAAYLVAGLPPR